MPQGNGCYVRNWLPLRSVSISRRHSGRLASGGERLCLTCLQIIGKPPRPELHKRKAPAGVDTALKHALVEEAAHMFDLEHDPVMVMPPSTHGSLSSVP